MTHDIDSQSASRRIDAIEVKPVYRRNGIIAALLVVLATRSANRQLAKATRRYRSGRTPDVPDYLRDDLGLPPLPPPLVQWWEVRR